MYWIENVIVVYGVIFFIAWWFMYGRIIKIIFTLKDLSCIDVVTLDTWPSLHIVIAACNEEEGIEPAIQSLLLQDYPNLKIILVNDRSTDNTGNIIDQLADDDRVEAVHIKVLPENWLGKVHALSVALERVDSEWILFTDADIHFEPGVLKQAVAYAVAKKTDHLALMPDIITNNYLLEVVVRTFGLMFLLGTRVDQLDKPNTKTIVGLGAFNLVKKSILDKSKGIKWLRMEVIDDVGMGLLINRAGGKSAFAMAQSLLSVAWYPTVRAMFVGLEKNVFGVVANYQITRLIIVVVFMWLFIFAPVIVLLVSSPVWLDIFALLTLLWIPAMMVTLKINSGARYSIGFFVPLGQLIFSFMLLWSAFICLMRGGIIWRGTLYSVKQLKKYQRLKF